MKERTFSNMSDAIRRLTAAGFTGNFIHESGHVYIADSGRRFKSTDLSLVDLFRFEGESDPDEMAILYVLEAQSGEKGILIDAFGIYGSKEVAEFMEQVPDARQETAPL